MKYIAQAIVRSGSQAAIDFYRLIEEEKINSSIEARNRRPPLGVHESWLLPGNVTVTCGVSGRDLHFTAFGDAAGALSLLFDKVNIRGEAVIISPWAG